MNRPSENIVLCKSIMRLIPVYCECICEPRRNHSPHCKMDFFFYLSFRFIFFIFLARSSNLTLLLLNCRVNDQIVKVNNIDVTNADRKSAAQAIRNCGGIINMVRRRRKPYGTVCLFLFFQFLTVFSKISLIGNWRALLKFPHSFTSVLICPCTRFTNSLYRKVPVLLASLAAFLLH